MVSYNIEAVHERIVNILVAFDEVCRKHQLRYYLWAGTMLGSVRHKGFIPWDDDADIAMPRPDYEQLISHADEWLPAPLEFWCAENNEAYPGAFGKICDSSTTIIERLHYRFVSGIYVDVFPIDAVPDNALARRWQFFRYGFYKRVLYLTHRDPYKNGRGLDSIVPLLCRRLFTVRGITRSIRRILTRYDYDACRLVADYDDGIGGVMDKSILGRPTPSPFCGHQLMGVEQADAYLSNKYGDYMTIPPQGRQRQHGFHYVDLEHSYKEFQDADNAV